MTRLPSGPRPPLRTDPTPRAVYPVRGSALAAALNRADAAEADARRFADAQRQVTELSTWVDRHNTRRGRDWETQLWSRVAKCAAEAGEALDEVSLYLGENPRKEQTATTGALVKELLDVATAAIGAVEHVTENQGNAMTLLLEHIAAVHDRAGLNIDVTALCGAENPDYPGEYACTFPKGHMRPLRLTDEDGETGDWDHAAPASGAYWSVL